MARRRHGGKITKAHTSIIDAAESLVRAAQKLPEVTKVSLGWMKNGLPPVSVQRIKFTPIVGGLRIDVRGSCSQQQIFVYTGDLQKTQADLEKYWEVGR